MHPIFSACQPAIQEDYTGAGINTASFKPDTEKAAFVPDDPLIAVLGTG